MKRTFYTSDVPIFTHSRLAKSTLPLQAAASKSRRTRIKTFNKRYSSRNVLITAISLIGCCTQITHVCDKYFRYKTVTQLTIKRPEFVRTPALSLCFEYSQMLDKSKLGIVDNSPNQLGGFTFAAASSYELNKIFNATLSIDRLLRKNCYTRHHADNSYLSKFGQCEKVFSVTKFYKERYICFSFEYIPRRNSSFIYSKLSNSFDASKLFYNVRFPSSHIQSANTILFFMQTAGRLPRGENTCVTNLPNESPLLRKLGQLQHHESRR